MFYVPCSMFWILDLLEKGSGIPTMAYSAEINRRGFLTGILIGGSAVLSASPVLALKLSRNKKRLDKGPFKEITPKERCPVCGMFVEPYPKWITQIQFKSGRHHTFDGMKCLIRFYFAPEKFSHYLQRSDFQLILVRDYYTLRFIHHDQAFYVFGSDVIGPMGHELIPFKDEEKAAVFKRDHKGIKILRFEEITPELIDLLDGSKRQVILDDIK